MSYQRIEVLTGSERRRQYTAAEKERLVDAAFRPGVVASEAARRLGVHESLLYRWRRQREGGQREGGQREGGQREAVQVGEVSLKRAIENWSVGHSMLEHLKIRLLGLF